MEEHAWKFILAVFTGLVAAVSALWRLFSNRYTFAEEKIEKSNDAILNLTKEVGELKGRVTLAEELDGRMKAIQDVTEETLRKVNENF